MSAEKSSSQAAAESQHDKDNGSKAKLSPTADASSSSSLSSPLPQQQAGADRSEVRFLIENSLVGGVIGTNGTNVKRVREETGTFISIVRGVQRTPERIMQLRGSIEQITHALYMIAELLIEAQAHAAESGNAVASSGAPTTNPSFRMLVHAGSIGAIMGKQGALLKETQTTTGVHINVSRTPLANSTEKTVQVTGTPSEIQAAFKRMLQQLRDNPPPQGRVVHYDPAAQIAAPYYPAMYGQVSMPPYGAGAAAAAAAPPPGPTSTQKIAIPAVCAGCIIGRGGSVIRDLRLRSGAHISIQDADPKSPNERVVTLIGAPQSINTAVYMIRQLVEQYIPRSANSSSGGGASNSDKNY
jgi:heterogeneous nuclear rnp K-like protein 2